MRDSAVLAGCLVLEAIRSSEVGVGLLKNTLQGGRTRLTYSGTSCSRDKDKKEIRNS